MHELWYKVVTPYATNMIRDYALAKRAEKNGATVEVVYRKIDLDHEVNEARRQKILEKYFS